MFAEILFSVLFLSFTGALLVNKPLRAKLLPLLRLKR